MVCGTLFVFKKVDEDKCIARNILLSKTGNAKILRIFSIITSSPRDVDCV